MHRMKTVAGCLLVATLASCAGVPPVDLCKGAEARRTAYSTAIVAADVYAATGRPVPQAVTLGRDAAVTALIILDAHCPRQAS